MASCDHSSVVLGVEMNTTYACFNCALALANESVPSISTFDGKSIFLLIFQPVDLQCLMCFHSFSLTK